MLLIISIVVIGIIIKLVFFNFKLVKPEGDVFAQEMTPLYVNGKEICEYNHAPGGYEVLIGNKRYSVEEVLEKKKVTLLQLQLKGLPCYRINTILK